MTQPSLPLLSIVVLTYNSSQYVLDTLESAYRQTYSGPIELIITDDCSSDDTVAICREWLKEKQQRFFRVELITARENTGVSKNINRGCRSARGEWIKPIAGDDILIDQCLEILYDQAQLIGDQCSFIIAPLYIFTETEELSSGSNLNIRWDLESNVSMDMDYLFNHPLLITLGPSFFLSKKMMEEIDYYDEIFINFEDAPLVRKAISQGYHVNTIDKPVAFYRCHSQSITRTSLNHLKTYRYIIDMYHYYLRPKFSLARRWDMFLKLLPIYIYTWMGREQSIYASLAFRLNRYFQISYYKNILKNK
ncbi:glycosyltransferase family 2 protein [Akkermansia sp.]|uniref:glycosyltransferase family 2 protein n=1 Tax=Akkermansia sp. TaxID=1872421 RepID=UPI0025C3F31C|nr:glycosyltransferase family 2 protein [Akkermansia sp.]MCC8149668.1 glycosyltransferase family 2 protein [Akkermansia sp.]